MWTLEKWYQWTSLERRNGDVGVENGHEDTGGRGR